MLRKITTLITTILLTGFIAGNVYSDAKVNIDRENTINIKKYPNPNKDFEEGYSLVFKNKMAEAASLFIKSANYEANREKPNAEGYEVSLLDAAQCFAMIGDYDHAGSTYKSVSDFYMNFKNYNKYLENNMTAVRMYSDGQKYDKAIELLNANIAFFKKCQESKTNNNSIAEMYKSIGVMYESAKKFDAARTNYNTALDLYKKVDNKDGITRVQDYLKKLPK